jgi:hypothetical protein
MRGERYECWGDSSTIAQHIRDAGREIYCPVYALDEE